MTKTHIKMSPTNDNRLNLRMLFRSNYGNIIDEPNFEWNAWNNSGVDRVIDYWRRCRRSLEHRLDRFN
jgi:hypothetical protein